MRTLDVAAGGSARIETRDLERIVIVGRGEAELTAAGRTAAAEPGSLILLLPGDDAAVANRSELLEGHVEMLLGEGWRDVPAGHLVFVASEVPHSLRNLGETPAVYFAIQGL